VKNLRGAMGEAEIESVVGTPFMKFHGVDAVSIAARRAHDTETDISTLRHSVQAGAEKRNNGDGSSAYQAAEERRKDAGRLLNRTNRQSQGLYLREPERSSRENPKQ